MLRTKSKREGPIRCPLNRPTYRPLGRMWAWHALPRALELALAHSVTIEDDFVSAWQAGFLGLNLQLELAMADIDVTHTYAPDKRLDVEESSVLATLWGSDFTAAEDFFRYRCHYVVRRSPEG